MSPLIRSLLRDWRKHYLKQQEQLCHKMVTKDITFGNSPYSIDPLSTTLTDLSDRSTNAHTAATAAAGMIQASSSVALPYMDYNSNEYPYSWNFCNNRFSRNEKNNDCMHYDSSFQHEDDELRYYFKPEESNLYLWHFVLYIKYTGEEICGMLYIKDSSEKNHSKEIYMVQTSDPTHVVEEYQVLIRLLTPNSNTAIPLNKPFDFTTYVDKDIFQKSRSLNTIFDHLWNFLYKNIVINKSTNNNITLHSGPLGKCWNRTILQDFKNLFPELYGLYHYTEMDQMYVQNWIRMQKYENELKRKPSMGNTTSEHEIINDIGCIPSTNDHNNTHSNAHKRNLGQQKTLGQQQKSLNNTDIKNNNGYHDTYHYQNNINTNYLNDKENDENTLYGNKKRKLNAQNYFL
ncbi:hypothetical protein ACO0RG_002819 [Hanseniaspora osmophila]